MSTTAAQAVVGTESGAELPPGYDRLLSQLGDLPPASLERSRLVEAAIAVWRRPGFDTFASLFGLHFTPFEHQLRAAAVVLRQMAGRAILADEVGLGKTIEAGIVLSELRIRGLGGRVLVLVPAGLVGQWQEELERKFSIPTTSASRDSAIPDKTLDGDGTVIVASIATARRDPLRSAMSASDWDLVIVDEAHRVRNPKTASAKLVRSLRSRYMLLLTATPIENRLDDLYHLVSMVRPGHLGTLPEFRRRHGPPRGSEAPERDAGPGSIDAVRAVAELRRSLRGAMVRHRRSEVALMLPNRLAETRAVTLSETDADLYRDISAKVREQGRDATAAQQMGLRIAQRLAGSSSAAAAPTLRRLGWDDLAERAADAGDCAKTSVLVTLLRRHAELGEKVIVFTSFRETLAQLVAAAEAAGIPAACYHGALPRRDKDAAIAAFERDVDVLLSTESAGEGRNLQFCHAMVNFDLPWNPMQIEQRLGRIHRIGQTHDVVLTNLVGRGTIEDRILEVLHAKLNLFELVVGELDMVLGRVDDEFVFEDAVFDAHFASADDDELAARIGDIGSALVGARTSYAETRARTDDLVAELEGEASVQLQLAGLEDG